MMDNTAGYIVLSYQPENVRRHADMSTVMHWSSSGQICCDAFEMSACLPTFSGW